MTYTIKQVAEKFNLSSYTIRYYDKMGLLPFVAKDSSGYRAFTESDLNLIHTICCLKDTGMPIKDIRTYIDDCMTGASTIPDRKALLNQHRQAVLDEIAKLKDNLKEIDYKLSVYSDTDAVNQIENERALVRHEKELAGLHSWS